MNKRKYYNHTCACGCGGKIEVKSHHSYNGIPRYICGHQMRNKHHSEETKQKQRESKLGDKNPMKRPEVREKMIASCLGKAKPKLKKIIKELWTHKEYRRKQYESHIGKHLPKEQKKKIGLSNTGKKRTDAAKKRYSKIRKGKTFEELYGVEQAKLLKQNLQITHTGKKQSSETIEKRTKKLKERLQNLEYKEKWLKAIFKGLDIKPNKPEILLNSILQQLFPNQYKYVGDGSVLIGYKNPDFINVKDHKIIELYGDYWHSKRITKRNRVDEERQRIKHFVKYGYQTLIIWEYELKDLVKLKEKLLSFNNN
jgi:G:T-mismatch repair DNA endonuclease (very short patch repair protein)